MARIVHIALKVEDLETATKFYEDVFGIYQTKTGYARGHTSRHMTDGNIDVALMVYDSEDVSEAKLSGAGPCIHHFGIEVEDRDATMKKIVANGGEIFSDKEEGALKFRAPDGNMAEIVGIGRYKKKDKSDKSRIVHLALKVQDLEKATKFYENVFGFKQLSTHHSRGHYSRHMTDGELDLALMAYNGGPARIRRAIKEGELDVFRSYPRRVRRDFRHFREGEGLGGDWALAQREVAATP